MRNDDASHPGLTSFPDDGLAVVIGASGGIGAALHRQLAPLGRFTAVHALGRRSEPPVDLLDEASIAAAAEHLQAAGRPRLVVDATGFLHGDGWMPEKSLRQLDPAQMAHAFAINATGPALLMKHLLPLFPREGKAVFATLSARVGSIADNRFGGWYSYRASKAALNQIVRSAAVELGRRRPESICVALHPGTVDTPLSAPFGKQGLIVRAPDQAAARLLGVIDDLAPADSGGFLAHDGARLPW